MAEAVISAAVEVTLSKSISIIEKQIFQGRWKPKWEKRSATSFPSPKIPLYFVSRCLLTVKGLNISFNEINDKARGFGLQQRVQTLPSLSRGSQDTDSFVDYKAKYTYIQRHGNFSFSFPQRQLAFESHWNK